MRVAKTRMAFLFAYQREPQTVHPIAGFGRGNRPKKQKKGPSGEKLTTFTHPELCRM